MSGSSSSEDQPLPKLAEEFERTGKRLVAEHLIGANFGNMSIRSPGGFFITRTGSFLDSPGSPVFVPLSGEVPETASHEYRVHREVYLKTKHSAIVHAHPPYAVACSLCCDRIEPIDVEGLTFSPVIRIVDGSPGSGELGSNVAAALEASKVVLGRGHGTFAGGKSLEEAYIFTSLAEHSCRVLVLTRSMGPRRPV